MQSDVNTTEKLQYGFPQKRRRVSSMVSDNTVQEHEFEGDDNVNFEYDAEYECASVKSDISYSGDHQPSLTDVLYYCQAMYDIVQKLDKKMDLLQRKVFELHHAQMKSHLKPRPLNLSPRGPHAIPQAKLRLHKLNQSFLTTKIAQPPPNIPNKEMEEENMHLQGSLAFKSVHSGAILRDPQQTQRLSPPLPTIVSTRSLHQVLSVTNNDHRDIKIESLPESTCASPPIITTPLAASSVCSKPTKENMKETEPVLVPHVTVKRNVIISEELPSSSVQPVPIYEFLGDPIRNIKVPGSFLVKARQKTQPKYAARYLVRALFPKDVLLNSATGDKVQGLMTLDVNKVSAIREFLASIFPECDLGEYGKDWKTCTTNVNAMIRCLHLETKKNAVNLFPNQAVSQAPEDSICLDSDDAVEEDHEAGVTENNQTLAENSSFLQANLLNKQRDNWFPGPPGIGTPMKHHSSDPIECFGEPWRNVQLPFSVIYIGKGKPRPELSARYLIRHLFPEDILVKSNVYGNLERGVLPLDSNRIGALKDFLQMNYPSFDLKDCGHDWKACVAAINSTIRSLRHDQKKATFHTRKITSLGS
ncbi:BEN domain-containing protein 2 [Rana temporaria]|uniref:BEN domain-containing protein 2 n=1 Tax=Rana temporaria TaxID=8407 RepID=UPI001AADD14D|nr:BEN domain-containing protein 2 [Rana temporaria]